MSYSTLKALHVIFMVSWFAGLFYIFRLFVYHVQNWQDTGMRNVFSKMESRLLKYIMAPAAIGTLVFGGLLLQANPTFLSMPWLWLKLFFVLVLVAYHGGAWWTYRRFAAGEIVLSEGACRIINEVPTVALIAICILVFLKPI